MVKKLAPTDTKTNQWLFNYVHSKLPNTTIENYLLDAMSSNKLESIVEGNDKWGIGSKERIYWFVVKMIKLNKWREHYLTYYREKAVALTELIKNDELKQKKSDKEVDNALSYNELLGIQQNIEHYETYSKHLDYLLISMITLQPPLRTNFYETVEFLSRIQEDDDNVRNYVWMNNRGLNQNTTTLKNYKYIVNKDKVSNTKEYSMNKKTLKFIEINPELAIILKKSYEWHPRQYVLGDLQNNPITAKRILSILRRLTGKELINIDMVRSAYVTHYYEKHPLLIDRNNLAHKMRHSKYTAELKYLKINSGSKEDENEYLKKRIEELENENIRLKQVIEDNIKQEFETWKKNNEKAFEIQRKDIIRKANKRHSIIKQENIDKYNIKIEDGIYI